MRSVLTPLWAALLCCGCAHGVADVDSSKPAPTIEEAGFMLAMDSIGAQLQRAEQEVCRIVDSSVVAWGFGVPVELHPQAMAQAAGPACGFVQPRSSGYILVVQLRDPSTWEQTQHAQRVLGLGHDSRLLSSSELVVQDPQRNAVVALISPESNAQTALLRTASSIYSVTAESVSLEAAP